MPVRLRMGDAVRVAMVGAATALLLAGNDIHGLAIALVIPAACAARFLPADDSLDALVCIALLAAQLGAVAGFTETTTWWDTTAHVVTGALVAALVAQALPSYRALGAVVVVALLAAGWEVLEWGIDERAGTDFSPSMTDTRIDLAFGVAGAIGGVVFLTTRASFRDWRGGSLRRAP
jgi:hypothetical protein